MSVKAALQDEDVVRGLAFGFKVLPGLVKAIESLFHHKKGKDRKEAVHFITNAAIAGAALGFNATGDTDVVKVLSTVQPVVSQSIDAIVDQFNTDGTFDKRSPVVVPVPSQPQQVKAVQPEQQAEQAAPQPVGYSADI